MGGGGANQPLINSLNTLNTLKNSNPKELAKNLNKIQDVNQLDLNHPNELKDSRLDLIQLESKIQDLKNLNQLKKSKNLNKIQEINLSKESENLNKIQMKSSKTTLGKISISIIASVLLSQNLAALPAGGKFIHGSGNISIKNGNTMTIEGNNKNHIIAWGGGFNINKGESVNFLGNNKSYLNLDYTNKASQILGNLNGNGNNIYLVNPSGVLIGQNASINANKFIASTSALSELELNQFKANGTTNGASFSPVYKPNKGNVVNLGTIKANNGITLIGDTIDIRGGKIENTKGGTNKDNSIYFVGENIYIDADAVNLSSNNNIYATAFKEGYIQRQMKNFQKDSFKFGNFNQLITDESYIYNNGNITEHKPGQNNFKKVITLGNGNADEALSEWYWFANGWNNNRDTRSVDEFRLVGNIDFSKQIGGRDRYIIDFSKNENDIDRSFMYSGNYYDPNNDSNHNDNMAVGKDSANAFQGIFDGGGNTLSNVDINASFSNKDVNDISPYTGIFGYVYKGTISNLEVDTLNIKITKNNNKGNYIGGIVGYSSNSQFSNIILSNIGSIMVTGSNANYHSSAYVGAFSGDSYYTTFKNIVLNNIGTIRDVHGYTGGFAGQGWYSTFGDIVINGVNSIIQTGNSNHSMGAGFIGVDYGSSYSNIVLNDIDYIYGSFNGGGFVGHSWGSVKASNITLNNIGRIFAGRAVGGFIGEGIGTFQNIVLNNIGTISGNGEGVGGFAGEIKNSTFQNIVLNNIGTIKASRWASDKIGNYFGGFVGEVVASNFSNIIMNNIGGIEISGGWWNAPFSFGGFAGTISNNSSFENIYIYFNPDFTITINNIAQGTDYQTGKFYGSLSGKTTFDNINLYYNDNPNLGLNNPIKNANSDSKDYHSTSNPNGQIFLNPYANETQGKEIFKQALEKQNNLGGAFESNKIVNIGDDSNPIYSFEQTTSSNITPPTDPSLPNIDLGNVVLEGSDFSVSILQEIINDILNGKYGINIDNREVLSNLAESLNNANTLQDYFNAINSYLISSSLDESTKESIRQSMDFLVAFYGENGLGNKFKGDTNYKDFYDKSFYISTSLKDLGNFISGDLNGRLDSMIKNIQILESLKQRIKAAQKYYQEALKAKLPYETLEGIYNGMVKTINESYIQALGVLETLKGEDRDYLTHLYKEYSIKEDSGFDDIRGTFSFSGNDILSKIDSIILEDKPALTPPTKEEVGDDPTKENNPDVPNNLQKIADLASKEAILILPAQEKQEAIVEDGKERGRLCIVSDNAKTNNPCMAITY
ncbi:filamentous hemagglutinin N-terminal domain-containing protein [Helicobacter pullorum]|uniref:Heme:hemopexin utilization protein A n=1 Tax=Helicobacter pullorum TaxID=35818 RepID=A0A377Q285_9HELI|nr:filamentous hemagglutinin N-terminal domain-containing protein [Helicobacter pullorum]STQ87983.1 Heme:hemopexin utilization protein A [Helicobacter pullorum]